MGTVLCGIAMYCSVESDLGVVASHQQAGWGAGVADNLYILFSLRFGEGLRWRHKHTCKQTGLIICPTQFLQLLEKRERSTSSELL